MEENKPNDALPEMHAQLDAARLANLESAIEDRLSKLEVHADASDGYTADFVDSMNEDRDDVHAAVEWLAQKMGCHDELRAFMVARRAR